MLPHFKVFQRFGETGTQKERIKKLRTGIVRTNIRFLFAEIDKKSERLYKSFQANIFDIKSLRRAAVRKRKIKNGNSVIFKARTSISKIKIDKERRKKGIPG